MKTVWRDVRQEKPDEGVEVYYYFDVFDQVYRGKYQTTHMTFDGVTYDCDTFYSTRGYLTDDVIYWCYVSDVGEEIPVAPDVTREDHKKIVASKDATIKEVWDQLNKIEEITGCPDDVEIVDWVRSLFEKKQDMTLEGLSEKEM